MLNEKDAKEFFEQVKDKKIKGSGSGWGKNVYFIPKSFGFLNGMEIMRGELFNESMSKKHAVYICNGFLPYSGDSAGNAYAWEFFDESDKTQPLTNGAHKCRCNLLDMLVNGCKCGGV